MEQRQRAANGTFLKGQPSPETARRKKGVLNKITRDIREGAIAGFARHGSYGRGEGGFAGFCFYLAKKHPKAAARIVEKLLPLQVNGTGLDSSSISTINVVSVPSEHYFTPEAIAQMHGPTLEHVPDEAAPNQDDISLIEQQPAEDSAEPAIAPEIEPEDPGVHVYTFTPPRPRQRPPWD